MGIALYQKHGLLDKIANILQEREQHELMCAHEIAAKLKKRYPQTVKALGKPVGGTGQTQDTLTRYVARLLTPTHTSPVEARQRFAVYIFGRSSVSTIEFKDGTSQPMNPAYGVVLFALRRDGE